MTIFKYLQWHMVIAWSTGGRSDQCSANGSSVNTPFRLVTKNRPQCFYVIIISLWNATVQHTVLKTQTSTALKYLLHAQCVKKNKSTL